MKHTLIIGKRQTGKSTLIQKVIGALGCTVSGFETKKETDLTDGLLGSPVYIYPAGQPHRQTPDNLLGYCRAHHAEVQKEAFDRAARLIADAKDKGELIVMDEIGFLETCSERFCTEVLSRLDGEKPVLAAVKQMDNPFLTSIRNHPNCRCFFLTEENRNALFPEVLQFVRSQLEKTE